MIERIAIQGFKSFPDVEIELGQFNLFIGTMLRERDREFPAPVLSDGTLRFAAIAAAFFQPDMPQIMTIEEIENGVHASRARLLVELIRRPKAVLRPVP